MYNAQNPLDTFVCDFSVDGEGDNLLRTCYEELSRQLVTAGLDTGKLV